MFGKVVLTGLGLIAFGLTRFVFNTLVIRLFPASFLGDINQVLSLFMLVPLFYAPALGMLISKFASEFSGANTPHKSQQLFSLSLVLVTVTSVICTIVFLVFFRRLTGSLQVHPVIVLGLAPTLALYGLYVFLRTSYYGFDRIALYLRNEILSSIVFFLVLGAALLARSRWLVVLPFAAHGAVFAALAIYQLRDQIRFRGMLAGIGEDLRRCVHFFVHTTIISLTGPGAFHLGIVLTGRLTGNSETAAYYSVLLYSLQPLSLLPISLASVMIPTISRHYGEGQVREGVAVAERAFLPLFLVMTLIWGGGVILGKEAVLAISGTAAGSLLAAFEVVLFGLYMSMIAAPPTVLLNSTKHVAVIAWSGVVAVVAAVAVWRATVPVYGLLGSAAGYALLQVGKGLWAFAAARRILRWRGRLGTAAIPTLVTIVALGTASLRSERLLIHAGLAILFVGLFSAFHARTLADYTKRLLAEVRSHAPGVVKPSDNSC